MEKVKTNEIVLLVGKSTAPGPLKTAAVGYLKSGKTVHLDCIGVATNYIATKAIIMARASLYAEGNELWYIPFYRDYSINNEEEKVRTGIRWTLKRRSA